MPTSPTDSPLITTIIPTYRRPALLRRAIESALSQEGPPSEIRVYDNASGDATRDMVSEMARENSRVRYFCHPENIGPHANFQYAFDRVETPFFSFLSDDDVLLPGFYYRALSGIAQNPSARLWAGTTLRMTEVGRIYDAHIEMWPREGMYSGMEGLTQIAKGRAPVWTGILFNREVLDTAGPLDPAVGSALDLDWLLRVTARHPFVVSKQPVAILIQHANSFSENAPINSIWPGWLKMIENLTSIDTLAPDDRELLRQMLRTLGKRVTFRHAIHALSKGNHDYVRAVAAIQQDFFHDSFSSKLLQSLSQLCARSSTLHSVYTLIYKSAVEVALIRRYRLQRRHGHLNRFLTNGKAS